MLLEALDLPPPVFLRFSKNKRVYGKNTHIHCSKVSGVLSFGGTNLAQSETVIDGIFTFARVVCDDMLVGLVQHTAFNVAVSQQANKSFVALTRNSVNVVRFLKQSAFVVFGKLLIMTRVLLTSAPVLHHLRNRRKIDHAHQAKFAPTMCCLLTVNVHRVVAEKDRCSNVSA